MADRLTLVDPQPHALLSTYYRAADVCLVPSRSESFGLVALEAAACGTPVIASAVGGLTTLVDHGRTGFLVEGPDPAAFADAAGASRPSLCWPSGSPPRPCSGPGTTRGVRRRPVTPGDPRRAGVAGRLVECQLTDRSDVSVPLVDLPGEEEMAAAVASSTHWLARALAEDGALVAAERQDVTDRTASHRWYLRFNGEEKDSSRSG